jgi:hypothetical protein
MDDLKGKALEAVMKKEVLYEPLQMSKVNYEEFFKK